MESSGTLSVVATPIGNLEDITLRAIRTLTEADYILCEDTRVTKKLLAQYEIDTPTKRYDAHTTARVHETILTDLENRKHIALVSDAGTPGISDPGVLLVRHARAVGARVEAIPGTSALTAALSIAGVAGNQFVFLGFAPQKKGRQTFFVNLQSYTVPVVFFESTHRIMKTLDMLVASVPDAHVSIAREITKMHEELVSGTPAELLAYFDANTDHQKGEFVVIVETDVR